ncbi:L,D-transpeptidase [Bosea vestrisii]|uniref:L,D-transpeptidase n=1 Tax=Bosea vestrisii TaxID=151416 RepID=A0ABW0HH23_9HYPH
MSRLLGILAFLCASLAGLAVAQAKVDVRVDIAAQRMSVATSDGETYNWAISSGRKGFRSPNGVYRPTRLERSWYSRKYGGAMPYAVFFRGGYAIHGTTAVGALGRPASHGCIRLHPANAAKLFALVKKHGAGSTRIALNGAATDNLSRFAKASTGSKHKIAKAKIRTQKAVLTAKQQRQGPAWGEAREQMLLRPAIPAGAIGFQPMSGPGWR